MRNPEISGQPTRRDLSASRLVRVSVAPGVLRFSLKSAPNTFEKHHSPQLRRWASLSERSVSSLSAWLLFGRILSVVLLLTILPTPSAELVISRYDEAAFPRFRPLFETPSVSSPLPHLARDPKEAPATVVLEDRSEKPITALRYRWGMTDEAGKHHTHTVSDDSYMVDVYRAVAEPGSRLLISPSGILKETLMDHVLAGGGLIKVEIGGVSNPPLGDIAELTFEIDSVLFADGEIAGPDLDRYAAELQCRKPAAEFIARQIRLAITEGRDVTPVLSALAEVPRFGRPGHVQGDPLVHWIRNYAQEYLHAMRKKFSTVDMREARLRHLENRPVLPKFYRRPQ
jgi:hypothetical protein